MSYTLVKKIRLEFSARWVSTPTDPTFNKTYFQIAAPYGSFPDQPSELGRSAEYIKTLTTLVNDVDANDNPTSSTQPRLWPLFLVYETYPLDPGQGWFHVSGWISSRSDVSPGSDPGSVWYSSAFRANFYNLPKPSAGTWVDYVIELEYPSRFVDPGVGSPVGQKGVMSVKFWINGVEQTIYDYTGGDPTISSSSINYAAIDPDNEANYQLVSPDISRSFEFYNQTSDNVPRPFDNTVEYDITSLTYTDVNDVSGSYGLPSLPGIREGTASLVADSVVLKAIGVNDPIEVIVGPYFSPSYITDDYVADGTLAAEAAVVATTTKLQLAAAALATDFQVAASGSTQKDIDLSAFTDAVMTVDGEKVSLGVADLTATTDITVQVDLTSDLSHDFVADFQLTAALSGSILGQANLAADFQSDFVATRLVEAEATLATDFQATCLAGRIVGPVELYPTTWDDIGEWAQWPFDIWEKRGLLMASVFEGYFNGGKIVEGASSIDADSQVAANGGYLTEGSAGLESTFDIEPGIGKITGGAGLVISDVALTALGTVTYDSTVDLASDVEIVGVSLLVYDVPVSFAADFQITTTPRRFVGTTTNLAADSQTAVIGSYIHGGAAVLVCDSVALAVGTLFKRDEYRTIRVLPEDRTWSMVRETRTATVPKMTRRWRVEGYEI